MVDMPPNQTKPNQKATHISDSEWETNIKFVITFSFSLVDISK